VNYNTCSYNLPMFYYSGQTPAHEIQVNQTKLRSNNESTPKFRSKIFPTTTKMSGAVAASSQNAVERRR